MINYPNSKKLNNLHKNKIYENRGMNFEHDLNESNIYYRKINRAIIYKKPTPIKVIKMNNVKKYIEHAIFEMPSTTDYNGIYKGKYIDFEAKETTNKTSFPLNNIHPHQIDHLHKCMLLGGISFIIVNFKLLDKIYILDINDFIHLNRKSIPLNLFKEKGREVHREYLCLINYLDALDSLYNI